jgi:hypothetical protein
MFAHFPLFNSHLELAHHYWKQLIKVGDHVIDATCGNGHDTLVLAEQVLSPSSGRVYAFDIQPQALVKTEQLLKTGLKENLRNKVFLMQQCHSKWPEEIASQSIKLIVYNLGYLPGGDKGVTTRRGTTLASIESGLSLLALGGAISITCYPGHEEGGNEEELILKELSKLDAREYSCCLHRWINRSPLAPSLLLIQKKKERRQKNSNHMPFNSP